MNICLKLYLQCLKEENPVLHDLQCAAKIVKCIKELSPKETQI